MKKLALPLVATLAFGACATTQPAESPRPSVSASPIATPSATPASTQIETAATLSTATLGVGVMRGDWVAFTLDGSPADWSFEFSNPAMIEFYPDGVFNEIGTYAGVRVIGLGTTTITATNGGTGETYTFEIECNS